MLLVLWEVLRRQQHLREGDALLDLCRLLAVYQGPAIAADTVQLMTRMLLGTAKGRSSQLMDHTCTLPVSSQGCLALPEPHTAALSL